MGKVKIFWVAYHVKVNQEIAIKAIDKKDAILQVLKVISDAEIDAVWEVPQQEK